jgi:pseudaminic acid cytidylyltransferase
MEKKYKMMALICCRGGSKGIPGKNIKEFAGKPLLGWILEAAKTSGVFDDIILSTDSQEIADVGTQYGASVPGLRPSELAQDKSDQFDTHRYIFEKMDIADETHRVCILTNNPFIDASIIKMGYDAAGKHGFEKVVLDTVKVGGDYLYYRQCFENKGLLRFLFQKNMLESAINRQSQAPVYTTINNTRWAKPSVLASYDAYKEEVVENGIVPIELPKLRNVDIDEPDDWIIAEALFNKLK